MRGLTGLLAALLLVMAGFALPRTAAACTGFVTPFKEAIPHAASIDGARVVTAAMNGTARRTAREIVAGPTARHRIEAGQDGGQDGLVVLIQPDKLGSPTAFGANLFYRFGGAGGRARALIDRALLALRLPDTATEPPGADDPDRPHIDPGAWPLLVLIVAMFVFGLIVRGSHSRPR